MRIEQCWKDQYMGGKLQIMEHPTRAKRSQILLLLFISANSTNKLQAFLFIWLICCFRLETIET